MAVDVVIRKKGFFKKKVSIQDIVFENMGYGVMDDNWRLVDGEIGEVTVLYNSENIGRGLEVVLQKDLLELRLPLPASEDDIKFFYQYIEKVCKFLKTDTFERNGETSTFDRIDDYMKWDISASIGALNQMRQQIEKKEMEIMYLFGVTNPIAVGERELEIIDDDLNKLGKFLHEQQSIDAYYAGVQVYQRDNGTIFAMYVLTEDVKSILPFKPLILMNNDIKVDDWYISFVYDEEMKGTITYENFINNVEKSEIYDTAHFLITMDQNKMKELIEKYREKV